MAKKESASSLHQVLIRLSEPIRENLCMTQYTPPESSDISIKSMLENLLHNIKTDSSIQNKIRDFSLCCSALASAQGGTSPTISWIPTNLSIAAESAFRELSEALSGNLDEIFSSSVNDLHDDFNSAPSSVKLVVQLMLDVLPSLKGVIKGSTIDAEDGEDISVSSARVPVDLAIVAAYQLRWFVTQVNYPYLGKLSALVIPSALTALDHWSVEVKGQAMVSFIHLAKNVNATELGCYENVILDACCQNIACNDELWHHLVHMSVLLVTCTQRRNPRSFWFEKMLNEMLGHLERQPKNMERRILWLQLIEPVFTSMGLVLLSHFRRIFPLFFRWMHVDDDKTIVLVLERVCTILKLTWVRDTPYIQRLVDELTILYKESAFKKGREEIRTCILQIILLLQQCKSQQFEVVWNKYKGDPNLTALNELVSVG